MASLNQFHNGPLYIGGVAIDAQSQFLKALRTERKPVRMMFASQLLGVPGFGGLRKQVGCYRQCWLLNW